MAEEDSEIEVKDRRRFLSEGGGTQTSGSTPREEKDTAQTHGAEEPATTGSEINFSSFILSLSTQALMCLGEVPDPQGGKPQQDLVAARQLIDVLGMLKEKTTGNLHQAEIQLLDHILFDLRMRYVKSTPR
jgi:hypothetical protein